MFQNPKFEYNEVYVAARLNLKPFQVKSAVERLELLGLLAEEDGKLVCTNDHIETADKDTTSSAHKKRIRQIFNKSIVAINKQDISVRNHATMTMAIDPRKIPEAKKRIFEFSNELCKFLEDGEQTEIYEFASALFSLEQ